MPAVQNGDYFDVTHICRMGDQVAENTFLYSIGSVIGTGVLDQSCIDQAATIVGAHLKACLNTNAEYRGAVGHLQTGLNLYQRVFSTVNQGAGPIAGDPLPKQVCGVITRRGEFAGRHHQGRVYVPFPSETHNEAVAGRPTIAYQGLLGSYAGDLYTALNVVVGGSSAILTPYYKFTSGDPPNTFAFPYVSSQTRDYWGTQRRRGDFGPRNISPI